MSLGAQELAGSLNRLQMRAEAHSKKFAKLIISDARLSDDRLEQWPLDVTWVDGNSRRTLFLFVPKRQV